MKKTFAAMAIAYPLLAHSAITTGNPELAIFSVLWLAALVLGPGLASGSRSAWIAMTVTLLALAILHRARATSLCLYASPVLINAGLAWLFGHTLLAGRTPFIERIVRHLHAPDELLDPAIFIYARRLTLCWTVLFMTFALVNLVLAAFAAPGGILLVAGVHPPFTVPREVWSAFANGLAYVIAVVFFIGEYAWRKRRFPQQPYSGILDFVRRASAIGPALWERR